MTHAELKNKVGAKIEMKGEESEGAEV